MKKSAILTFAIFLTVGPAVAQTQGDANDSRTESRHNLSYGLVGLVGLLGLLGLRRPKSAEHQRMASKGINVSTVGVHYPERS